MKLTNEDLRKIILEEIEEVLKEFHPAVDEDDDDLGKEEDPLNPEKTSSQEVALGLKNFAKNLPKKPVPPTKLAFLKQTIEKAVGSLDDPDLTKQREIARVVDQVEKRFDKK